MTPIQPVLFISHGAPTWLMDPGDPGRALKNLADTVEKPDALLVISAHWQKEQPTLTGHPSPGTIHDFLGFPQPLYDMIYPAPGNPALAGQVADLLHQSGFVPKLDDTRGLDHGVWVPLSLLYPAADVPVIQLSLVAGQGPRFHYNLGSALTPLRRRKILIVASGGATHNLRELSAGNPDHGPAWVEDFRHWLADRLQAGDTESVIEYRNLAPSAQMNHPSEEHILPLHVALGAAGQGTSCRPVGKGLTYGVIVMDSYMFEGGIP